MVANEANYKMEWIENIVKKLRIKLEQFQFV